MSCTFRHFEHAIAVAKLKSFRRAAEALGISQPGLSRSIGELERRLAARLFDRHGAGVELTVVGELVVERGRALLLDRTDLEDEVERIKGLAAGSLSVDLGPYPAVLYAQEAVARLLGAYPGISCELRVTHWRAAIASVRDRSSHLAIAELSVVADDPRLKTEPLVSRPGAFVCRAGHPLLGMRDLTVQKLARWPWVGTELPARAAQLLPAELGRAGRRDPASGHFIPAVQLEMMDGVGRVARHSDVVVLTMLTTVADELERGELKVLPFAPPWLRLNAGFISLCGRTPPPAVAAFKAVVTTIEAELTARESALRGRHARG